MLKQHAHLRGPKGPKRRWDWRTVDGWIDDLLGSPESVNTLINITFEDAEDVASVS